MCIFREFSWHSCPVFVLCYWLNVTSTGKKAEKEFLMHLSYILIKENALYHASVYKTIPHGNVQRKIMAFGKSSTQSCKVESSCLFPQKAIWDENRSAKYTYK